MKQEETIEIPEENTITSKKTPSPFRSPKKNQYYYGLETPVYIRTHYMLPLTGLYIAVFAFITVIPFVILRISRTPYDTYPTTKIDNKQSLLVTLLLTACFNFNMSNIIFYSMDIIYYLRFRYYTFEFAKSNMQNLTAITFFFALILCRKFWLGLAKRSYWGHQDTITMWKFSILQIKQEDIYA
ncbi:hypothetical protein EDC94DRAFT_618099 [Helicostylum pulchrum]|nr:hypothetical protein EDC94DRAFT_618099 [Helicostylum pulchrum]